MSDNGRNRTSASDPSERERASSRRSRRSRVSEPLSYSPHQSSYNDLTDRDSLDRDLPPLPMKPPGDNIPINSDPRLAGKSAEEFYNSYPSSTPTDETPLTPTRTPTSGTQALSRPSRRSSSHGLSLSQSPSRGHSSRRTKSHSSTRDILRVLLSAETSQSKEALTLLRRVQERLEIEGQRANEAERRVQEANERWRLINQARVQAQSDASRASEELRLYKLQLETAQQQIARANDMIALTEKERTQAEDEAAKAKRLAKKFEMEREIQRAREDGRREGLRQGRREAREAAAYEPRYLPRDTYDRYRDRPRPRDRDREVDDGTYVDDDITYQYLDDEEYVQPGQFPVSREVSIPQSRQPFAPTSGIPGRTQSAGSRGPRRSSGIIDAITRLGRAGSGRRESGYRERGMDRNVAVNPSNAPDVASIIDAEPVNALASPLPAEQTTQINHTTPMRMPEPDFDPDPSEVRPISIPGTPRLVNHPQGPVPPDGWIPRQDEDGTIRIPPPHDMSQAPPTPRSYASPLPNTANLPPNDPELPQRERGPIPRDYAPQPRSHGRHRYQKSVAESEDSDATANLSIISPPGQRPSTLQQSRLSAIPEHDPRFASPSGSMRQAEPPVYPTSPRSRSSRHAEADEIYVPGDPILDPALANRRSMGNGGPGPRDMNGAFSPRSNHSRFSGPTRPSRITTPAPLASEGLGAPAYTRPRTHSVASGSENGVFMGTPRSSRSRDMRAAPEQIRSRPGTASNTPAHQTLPEIHISPASHFDPSQSNANAPPDGMMSPRRTPSQYTHVLSPVPSAMPMPQPPTPQVHEPPSPADIPGMPKGFVPTSPMPDGFIPVSPVVAPPDAPPGFQPTSPAVHPLSTSLPPDVPAGFIPTSPAVIPGAPAGFFPTSPAIIPGAPPGFVPTSPAIPPTVPSGQYPLSPAIPDGAPLGFIPSSPAPPPQGAPLGFVPSSSVMPMNPLPQPSPAMSTTGALPVLARSESMMSPRQVPTVTRAGLGSPRLSFSGPNPGFNSRAASDWDTRSAWGDPYSEHQTPRPVREPDLSATIVRPGSSLSRKNSGPVIPDREAFRPSRYGSRAGDPAGVPLPGSTAPSLARSGRASSYAESRSHTPGPGVARSQSARTESSTRRGKIYPPGTPAHPAVSGLPPAGLESPYSRSLDPHPEDADEYEIVPSDDSNNTLTTPPGRRGDLPPPGSTPAVSARNSLYARSPGASRVSFSASGDPASGPSIHRSASRQSIGSNASYAKYDPSDYVDPAVLTSGRSRLLPLPPPGEPVAEPVSTTAKGKKGKGKKGKGKNR